MPVAGVRYGETFDRAFRHRTHSVDKRRVGKPLKKSGRLRPGERGRGMNRR